ncbi:MAG: Tll0287-like domain-containing protein [Verrucomicrobiota bacterium]
MKARSYPVVLSLACGLGALVAARAAAADTPAHVFVNPDDPRVADIRRAGERVIDHAGTALVLEVRRVLASTAPSMAIGLLHLKEYQPPAPVPGQPAVASVHRTSLRLRNPANAPDGADQAALELIQRQLDDGDEVAKVLVQRVTLAGRPPEWRVYRPLVTLKLCLDCHGPPGSLAPGVPDTLKVFYPADEAVDFRTGSWRGLLRASIPDSVPKS